MSRTIIFISLLGAVFFPRSIFAYSYNFTRNIDSAIVVQSVTVLPAQTISGRVFLDSAIPQSITNAEVCLDSSSEKFCTLTDAQGKYYFPLNRTGWYEVSLSSYTLGNVVMTDTVRSVYAPNISQSIPGIDFVLQSAQSTLQAAVRNIPEGTSLDVLAFNMFSQGMSGPIVRELRWNGERQRSVQIPVGPGTWEVRLAPWIPKAVGVISTGPTATPFVPPEPAQVAVTGAGNYSVELAISQADHRVTGQVIDEAGAPIASAFVFARPVGDLGKDSAGTLGSSILTSADGSFTLALQQGIYIFQAMAMGMPPSPEIEVTVAEDKDWGFQDHNSSADVYQSGQLSLQVILKIQRGERVISGIVQDEDGIRLTDSYVSAEQLDENSEPAGFWVNTPTDSQGAFILRVSSGRWRVQAFAPTYGEVAVRTISVGKQDITGLTLSPSLQEFGMVQGRVMQGVSPVEGAYVNIWGLNGWGSAVTDSQGAYTLRVRAGADYTLGGLVSGIGPLPEIANLTVSAGATLRNQNFVLAEQGTLKVTIPGVRSALVSAWNTSGAGNETSVDTAAGVYSLSLPADSYTVQAYHPDLGALGQKENVSVRAGQITALQFDPPSTYAVSGSISSGSRGCQSGVSAVLLNLATGFFTFAISNDSGAWSAAVTNGDYELTASKPGCIDRDEPAHIKVAGTAVSSGTSRTLVLASASISGRVLVSGSNVSADTVVFAESSTGDVVADDVDTTAKTSNNYTLSLGPGTWTITVRSEGYASAPRLLALSEGDRQTVNFTLEPLAGFTRKAAGSALVKPTQGGIVKNTDVGEKFEIKIPAGALGNAADSNSISTKVTTAIVPKTETVQVLGGKGIEITAKNASGTVVNNLSSTGDSGATIEIPYTDAEVAALSIDESKLKVGVWSAAKAQWEPLATTVDTAQNLLKATTRHFSVFAPIAPKTTPAPAPIVVSQSRVSSGGGGGWISTALPQGPTYPIASPVLPIPSAPSLPFPPLPSPSPSKLPTSVITSQPFSKPSPAPLTLQVPSQPSKITKPSKKLPARLFDLALSIPVTDKKVFPGADLRVSLNLSNSGSEANSKIALIYTIQDAKKKTVFTSQAESLTIPRQLAFVQVLRLPAKLKPGKYTLTVQILKEKASARASFEIVKKLSPGSQVVKAVVSKVKKVYNKLRSQ